jgi:hypothetical protein
MAFATSNIARENLGSANLLRGTWTGASTDTANGTVTGKGFATRATFLSNNSTGPENAIPARITNSSGTWTVSVPYNFDVTAGTFEIVFK